MPPLRYSVIGWHFSPVRPRSCIERDLQEGVLSQTANPVVPSSIDGRPAPRFCSANPVRVRNAPAGGAAAGMNPGPAEGVAPQVGSRPHDSIAPNRRCSQQIGRSAGPEICRHAPSTRNPTSPNAPSSCSQHGRQDPTGNRPTSRPAAIYPDPQPALLPTVGPGDAWQLDATWISPQPGCRRWSLAVAREVDPDAAHRGPVRRQAGAVPSTRWPSATRPGCWWRPGDEQGEAANFTTASCRPEVHATILLLAARKSEDSDADAALPRHGLRGPRLHHDRTRPWSTFEEPVSR